MTPSRTGRFFTLGIFPSAHGFGWVVFEGPLSVVAHGIYTTYKHKDERCLKRADYLMGRYRPETVVFEVADPTWGRAERIRHLNEAMMQLARDREHDVRVFTRDDVRETFVSEGATTRAGIACAVARLVPALAFRLPKPRRFADGEAKCMSMYNAAALVLTHYRNGATALLDDLRDAA